MKEINLSEILEDKIKKYPIKLPVYTSENTRQIILSAMKEACKATVNLCAENAEIKDIKINYTGVRAGGYYILKEVDKESILKIKQLIK